MAAKISLVGLIMSSRLAKCHHPHHPGWSKIFRAWVKFGTEHMVYCQKNQFVATILHFLGGLNYGNAWNIMFKVFLK